MKSRFTFLLIAIGLHAALRAQENPTEATTVRNRIGIAFGIGHVQWTDKNSSPLTYRSIPKNVRLFYNLETVDAILTVDLDVRIGGMKSKQHPDRTVFFQEEDYKGKKEDKKFPVGGSFLAGRFSIGAFYKTDNRGDAQTAIGIRVQEEMFYPQGWVSAGMFNAISFSPTVLTRKIDDKHHFMATLNLPGVSYLTRLPYHNTVSAPNKTLSEGFFRNAKWRGPGGYTPFGLALSYQYQKETNWSTGATYEMNTYRISEPQEMKALSHALLIDYSRIF